MCVCMEGYCVTSLSLSLVSIHSEIAANVFRFVVCCCCWQHQRPVRSLHCARLCVLWLRFRYVFITLLSNVAVCSLLVHCVTDRWEKRKTTNCAAYGHGRSVERGQRVKPKRVSFFLIHMHTRKKKCNRVSASTSMGIYHSKVAICCRNFDGSFYLWFDFDLKRSDFHNNHRIIVDDKWTCVCVCDTSAASLL